MTLHWSAAYVGTPYLDFGRTAAGCDCWGIVRLALFVMKGIVLPSYDDISPEELAEIDQIVHREVGSGVWVKVDARQEFDVAVFRRGRHDSHVGIMVDDRRMLHSDKHSGGARVERIDNGRWASQLVGYYRHRDLI